MKNLGGRGFTIPIPLASRWVRFKHYVDKTMNLAINLS